MHEDYFDNSTIINLLSKWRVHIIAITITSAVISFFMAYLTPPKYTSYAVVYPVNIGTYSDESNTEQMLQILDSRDIKDNIAKSFNLIEHYNINKEKKDYLNSLYSRIDKNISIKKTEYESVRIDVLDKNAEIASQIVDSTISFYNQKVRNLYQIKIKEVIDIAKNEVNVWTNIRDSINKELAEIRLEYGINDYKLQFQEVSKGIYRTNDKSLIKEGKSFLDTLGNYGPYYERLSKRYYQADNEVNKAIIAYNKSLKEYNKNITYAQVITEPFVSYKKNYTKRVIIMIFGIFSSFLLSIIVILLISKKK